jgi:hypothetical protein
MEIVNVELAEAQRHARVERRFQRYLAGIQRHRDGERLEGRSHFVDAGGQPIDARRIERLTRIVGVVIRLRHHGDDLAGAHVEDDASSGQRLEFSARGDQFVAQRMLHAQIDG